MHTGCQFARPGPVKCAKDVFSEQFAALGTNLKQIVEDMGAFGLVRMIDENAAECELPTVKDGIPYSFQVLFVRDLTGNWGIHNF